MSKVRTTNGLLASGQPQARVAGRGVADVVLERGASETVGVAGADPGKKTSPSKVLRRSGKWLKVRSIYLACAESGLSARGAWANVSGAPKKRA